MTILQVWDANYDTVDRDSELIISSLHPPHSGPLYLLWAAHVQSLDDPLHKPAGSSPGLPGGRLADIWHKKNTSYTQHTVRVIKQVYSNMCRSTSAIGTFTWHHMRTQRHSALHKSVGGIVEQMEAQKACAANVRVNKIHKCTHEGTGSVLGTQQVWATIWARL